LSESRNGGLDSEQLSFVQKAQEIVYNARKASLSGVEKDEHRITPRREKININFRHFRHFSSL